MASFMLLGVNRTRGSRVVVGLVVVAVGRSRGEEVRKAAVMIVYRMENDVCSRQSVLDIPHESEVTLY